MKHKLIIVIFSFIFSIIVWGSITLSDQFYSSYDLNVKVVNTPNGYSCGIINPKTLTVKLKAKGWQLLALNLNPISDFMVSTSKDSGNLTVDAYDQIQENTWIGSGTTIIDISPRNIGLKVERIQLKKLKVIANTDISFQSGYGLAKPVKVYPDSILVAGPKSLIEKMSSIKTKYVSLSSLDSKIKYITELADLDGFEYQQNKVELTLDVQRIVDNMFNGIKVSVSNIPPDRDIVLIPNSISCSLRGGINIVGKITPEQISATLDYRDIILDTLETVRPKITIPPNTELLFVKPEELRYIIKKFE